MGKWKTRTDGTSAQVGQKFEERESAYPYGARRRASGISQAPQPRSVDSMKKPQPVYVETPGRTTELSLSEERVDRIDPTQPTNPERVEHFEEAIKRGETIPPLLVHETPSGRVEVMDGHHRLQAYKNMGAQKVPVVKNFSLAGVVSGIAKAGTKIVHSAYSGVKEGLAESREEAKERAAKRLDKKMQSKSVATRRSAIREIREKFSPEMEEAEKMDKEDPQGILH